MTRRRGRARGSDGPTLTVVYWRDIPAQVIVSSGERTAKRELSERFQEAIDACARQVGARDTAAYLAEWRRGTPTPCAADLDAEAAAAQLEDLYDRERIKTLVQNAGYEPAGEQKEATRR